MSAPVASPNHHVHQAWPYDAGEIIPPNQPLVIPILALISGLDPRRQDDEPKDIPKPIHRRTEPDHTTQEEGA